jgi:hypothetical protein
MSGPNRTPLTWRQDRTWKHGRPIGERRHDYEAAGLYDPFCIRCGQRESSDLHRPVIDARMVVQATATFLWFVFAIALVDCWEKADEGWDERLDMTTEEEE